MNHARLRSLSRTFRTAWRALRRNVLRSALTTLGIVIGISAVIAMMEIGHGSSVAIQKNISSFGADMLVVFPGTAASGGVSFGAGTGITLTAEDCDAIVRECPSVRTATPVVRARSQVVAGGRNWVPLVIAGTTPAYLDVRGWGDLAEGESFTEQDVRSANKVCLLGQTITRQLFPGQSAVGEDIRIQNVAFRVVGVLRAKGANVMGMDQDDVILAPWTSVKRRISGTALGNINQSASAVLRAAAAPSEIYPGQPSLYPIPSPTQAMNTPLPVRFANVDQILAAARSTAECPRAIEQMTTLLRQRHRIRAGELDDFSVRDMTEITRSMTVTTSLMTNLLLFVALISLVVGGVGIMNIMFVSVTERTREIGLRMAVGARAKDILAQFLIEAIVLCIAGGVLGIVIGRGASIIVRQILHWPTQMSPGSIFAAVAVSMSVGLVFGYYPAWKASRLHPIEALRFE